MDNRHLIQMNEDNVNTTMKLAKISGVSIVLFDDDGLLDTKLLGVDHQSKHPLTAHSIFRAASLSKPVFAFLVLKLIIDNQQHNDELTLGRFKLPNHLKEFTLDTPLYEVMPSLLDKFSEEDRDKAKKITAKHVLTHQTGLPIKQVGKSLKFLFEPGTQFGYSNLGILLLKLCGLLCHKKK